MKSNPKTIRTKLKEVEGKRLKEITLHDVNLHALDKSLAILKDNLEKASMVKIECENCEGRGTVLLSHPFDLDDEPIEDACSVCGGRGFVYMKPYVEKSEDV